MWILWALVFNLNAAELEKADWYSCQADSDCVLKPYICGVQKAVNKKWAQEFADHMARLDAACTAPRMEMQAEKTACLNGFCQVIFKSPVSK